jgi:Fasciclin domain
MKLRAFAMAAVAASLVLAACGEDDNSAVETTVAAAETTAAASETTAGMTEEPGTIVDVASGNPDFSTLVAAVGAAGLVETLSGEGPFTVFAPTNDAFAALPAGLVDKLLLPENKDVLVQILTYRGRRAQRRGLAHHRHRRGWHREAERLGHGDRDRRDGLERRDPRHRRRHPAAGPRRLGALTQSVPPRNVNGGPSGPPFRVPGSMRDDGVHGARPDL